MTTLKQDIKSRGMQIYFIETEAGLPKNTLHNFIQGRRGLAPAHIKPLNKVLKKYNIQCV